MTEGFTRRGVIAAGAAAGAALTLVRPSVAAARSPVHPALRRSGWTPLLGRTVGVAGHGSLVVTAVDDVADAAARNLAGSEDAFVVSFAGPALPSAMHTLSSPSFGSPVVLFVTPVSSRGGTHELLVDRSVRIASINPPEPESSTPEWVSTPDAADPTPPSKASKTAPAGAVKPAKRFRFLRSVRVRRARGTLRAEMKLSKDVRSVHVVLSRAGVVYARGSAVAGSRAADARLRPVQPRPGRGRYDLAVTATDRTGATTTVRRVVSVRS